MKTPCYSCKEREINCHSRCKKYKEYREVVDHVRKQKKIQTDLSMHKVDAIFRTSGKGGRF